MHNIPTYCTAFLVGIILSSYAAAYEEPAYATFANVGGIEYRQYQPYLVAETVVTGTFDRDEAANVGFRRLFRYISGENTARSELQVDPIVKQQRTRTKIAMTTPVRQTPLASGWSIAFVVPREFNQTNVPQPTDPNVYITTVPGLLMAVARFSGRWTDKNVNTHKSRLASALASAGLTPIGEITTAFYNAPFTLPFMRRNEVMVAVNHLPAVVSGDR